MARSRSPRRSRSDAAVFATQCSLLLCLLVQASGCGPRAMYLRDPAHGEVFAPAVTVPAMPEAFRPWNVTDGDAPGARDVSVEQIDRLSSGRGLQAVTVRKGVGAVCLLHRTEDGHGLLCHPTPLWSGVRPFGDGTIVDVVICTYNRPLIYYWDIFYYRLYFGPDDCLEAWDTVQLGEKMPIPHVVGGYTSEGHLQLLVSQEAIRALPVLSIPLGVVRKTSLLEESTWPASPSEVQ